MRILALETTELAGSVAALEDDRLIHAQVLDPLGRSAQSLIPSLVDLWEVVGWDARSLDLVCLAIGPGSFTGLRVGVTAAKMLAYASGSGLLGVNTLEVVAAQTPLEFDRVAAAVDAQRGQVVARTFRRDLGGTMQPEDEERMLDTAAWLAGLSADVAITGPALRKRSLAGVNRTVVPQEFWSPQAATVGRLAWRDWQAGRRDDIWQLVPHYVRKPAAEEKWEEKQGRKPEG